jgi:hypothetical protein
MFRVRVECIKKLLTFHDLEWIWQPSTIRTIKTLIMFVESTIYTSSSIVRFLGKVTNFGGKGTANIFLYYLLIKSNFHDDN